MNYGFFLQTSQLLQNSEHSEWIILVHHFITERLIRKMWQREPERTGQDEDYGRPENDAKPLDHQEQIQTVAALFGPSRPKDVVTGTANGVAIAVTGAGAGVGALFALPAIGAAQGGAVRLKC
jgi:hypothetical protein